MRVQPAQPMRTPNPLRARTSWLCVLAGFIVVALAPVAGQQPLPSPAASPAPASAPATDAQSKTNDSQAGKQNSDAVHAGGKKQAAEESGDLLKLATGLKAEVDKTTQDTLSLAVVHKAAEIERVAHAVREKEKVAAAANRGGGS